MEKTFEEERKERQELLAYNFQRWHTAFAWFPTQMYSGEWVWLEKYQWRLDIVETNSGSYYLKGAEPFRRSMKTKELAEAKLSDPPTDII